MSVDVLSRRALQVRPVATIAAPLLCALAFCAIAAALIFTRSYPGPFDELEQISYAAFLQESGRLLPQFEAQRILAIGDMGHWTDWRNYLGHPSPFYLYISLFLDRTLDTARAIVLPRLASAALILAGVLLALDAGYRHFRQDRLAVAVFCLALALCPKLLAVASQVNNDSLAFLGGALAYWGASAGRRARWPGLAASGAGLALALWAKPNAGLLVGAWLGCFWLVQVPRNTRLLLALAAGAAAGGLPYWFIVARYGALVPVTAEQFGHVRQLDGFASYLPAFLTTLGYTWSFSHTGTWPLTRWAAWITVGLFWSMMACAVLAGALAWRQGRTTRDVLAVAGPVAFSVVLPVHLWFCATRLGFSLPAASLRYYLPLWPLLAHALAYGSLGGRAVPAAITLAALAVGWLSP